MEIVGSLTFVFIAVCLSGFIVLFLYIFNPNKQKGAAPDDFSLPDGGHPKRIDIKFYRLALFFVALCIQGILLFPWLMNVERESWGMFLFLISLVAMSYMFVWVSKGFDWKK